MCQLNISQEKINGLQELINLGAARAGNMLQDMLGVDVTLTVPALTPIDRLQENRQIQP